MSDGILKAYCNKIDQYFLLELKKVDSVYKVTNMSYLDKEKAKVVSSTIRQSTFESNTNVLKCQYCGSRVVGGCSCATTKICCKKNMPYNINCLYCKNLKIDYSSPDASAIRGRIGDEIILNQNQKIKISDLCLAGEKIEEVKIAAGWDPASKTSTNYDIDLSVIMLNSETGSSEVVAYYHLDDNALSSHHYGDNLTGEEGYVTGMAEDDECILVKLNKTPLFVDKLFFVINIYKSKERYQTFGLIKNIYVKMYESKNNRPLASYRIGKNDDSSSGLIVSSLCRVNGEWEFKALGNFNRAGSISELIEICKEM